METDVFHYVTQQDSAHVYCFSQTLNRNSQQNKETKNIGQTNFNLQKSFVQKSVPFSQFPTKNFVDEFVYLQGFQRFATFEI